jgi:hypothetical protein
MQGVKFRLRVRIKVKVRVRFKVKMKTRFKVVAARVRVKVWVRSGSVRTLHGGEVGIDVVVVDDHGAEVGGQVAAAVARRHQRAVRALLHRLLVVPAAAALTICPLLFYLYSISHAHH